MKLSKSHLRLNEKLLTVLDEIQTKAAENKYFSHITHTVEFNCFPSSLLVLIHCQAIESADAITCDLEQSLQKLLHRLLLKKGIVLKKPSMNLKVSYVK